MGLFGKDQITIMVEKFNYNAGETIKGTIKVHLKKPMGGRKLTVSLIGMKISRQSSIAVAPMAAGRGRHHHSSSQHQVVYKFDIPLDGEKEYHNQDYPFELPIPQDILSGNPTLDGKLGQASTAFRALTGISSQINWSVKAQLDVPKKIDIRKAQQIVISENKPQTPDGAL